VVYAAALRSEHATRQVQNRHIKHLEWSPAHLNDFFVQKLRRVLSIRASEQQVTLDSLFKKWLGFDKLKNGRNQEESVYTYILRHSRMLPRDVILFGNAISEEIEYRTAAHKGFGDVSLRKAVASVAKIIGHETIGLCLNEMLSASEFFEEYIAIIKSRDIRLFDFRVYLEDKIARFFANVREEIIPLETLRSALVTSDLATEADFQIGANSYYRFDNVLWRQGLLACEEDAGTRRWTFNWKGAVSADVIPSRASRVGFHPSLIDVYGVRASPDGPITAF
jgi:hypothetical protein